VRPAFGRKEAVLLCVSVIIGLAVVGAGAWRLWHTAPIKAHDMSRLEKVMAWDAAVWWWPKPHMIRYRVTGRCWDHPVDFRVSTNAEGMRGKALAPAGTHKRILALGDSITFGLGVEDAETWPCQMEQWLNNATPATYEVLNAGVPGFSALQGLRYLDKHGLALEPAAVVACFGQNDFDCWNETTDLERAAAVIQKEKPDTWSDTDRFIVERGTPAPAYAKTNNKAPRLTPDDFEAVLKALKHLCDAHHVPLVIVLWPQDWQVLQHVTERQHYEPVLAKVCSEMGIPLVDLLPVFQAETRPLYIDPVHGNATGCRVAAEAIARAVAQVLGTGH
jgi:lysophospholipase L1-like esterase